MRPSWSLLAPSWGPLGPSWALFGPSWSLMGTSWSLLVATLGPLVAILRRNGPTGGHRGRIWVQFCLIWDQFWTILGPCWHHFLHIPDQISDHKDCCVFVFVLCAVAFRREFHCSKQKISCEKHTRNTCTHTMWRGGMRGAFEYIYIYIHI